MSTRYAAGPDVPVAREVLRHAAAVPGRLALVPDDGAPLTYGDLARRACALAVSLRGGRLPSGPVRAGDVVAVDLGPAPVADELVALLAVDLVGGVPLLCDGGWTAQQRRSILGATQPRHHLTVVPDAVPGTDVLPGTAALPLPGTAASVLHEAGDADLAWAGFTSGSTGRPRAVVRTRGSWTGSFAAVTALTGVGAQDTVLVPGPLATSLYCFAAVHALAVGATVRHTPGRASFLGAAATCDVVHLVPGDLALLLDSLADAPGPLPQDPTGGATAPVVAPHRVRTAVVGGAALPPGARRRAELLGIRVVAYYGATELSFVAVDDDGTGLRPFPGVEVEVRSQHDAAPQDAHPALGQVWVRSPWLASGYLAGADGPLRRESGWATVGDLAGPVTPDGRLVLRGRGSSTITTGAATVVCEDVEAALRDCPGVDDVVVLGDAHPTLGEVVAAVVVGPARLGALEAHARTRLSPAQRPRRWYTTDHLPRTVTGKPARAELAHLLAERGTPGPAATVRRVQG